MARCTVVAALMGLASVSARMSVPGIPTIQTQTAGNHGNAGVDPKNFRCVLDPKITVETLPFFEQDIKMSFGALCSTNRGVFVLDPPDGHTYGCAELPSDWGPANVNEITNQTLIPAAVAVESMKKLVKAVYHTTTSKDARACDFESISTLLCGREEPWRRAPWVDKLKAPIRAVNLGGLFVLERWILPNKIPWGEKTGIIDQHSFSLKCEKLGICEDLKKHFKEFYSPQDFHDMKKVGLNSVRLPVGWWMFASYANINSAPYVNPDEDLYDINHPLTQVLKWAQDAGLQVILDLHGAPGSQNGLDNSGIAAPDPNNQIWGETWAYSPAHVGNTVKTLAAMAEYINHAADRHAIDNVMAVEVLNEPWAHLDIARVRDFYVSAIEAIRLVRPHLPIFLHDSFRGPWWQTLLKDFPYPDVFMDTHIYHGFNPSDAASDTPIADRQKAYTHERMACGYGSMLRYQTCSALPTAVLEWSLAIDNCMPHLDPKKQDYGQCNSVAERLDDSWWTSHIRSFASRQIAVFEKEMGWAFWCWKLDDEAMKSDPSANFWSFKLAVAKGYIDTTYPRSACMHPPADDWATPQKPLPPPPPSTTPIVEESVDSDEPNDNIQETSSGMDTHVIDEHDHVAPDSASQSASSHGFSLLTGAAALLAVGAVLAVAVNKRRSSSSGAAGSDSVFSTAALRGNGAGYTSIDNAAEA